MDEKTLIRTSKFLSLVLRHAPERIGLQLDREGWVTVDALLHACRQHGHPLNKADLDEVVATNSKKRFAFSEDGKRIRASQGHSVEVSLGYTPQSPPPRLFHGTAFRFLDSILLQGLLKQERHHVHLSSDADTAIQVGMRHGKPAVLIIRAAEMQESGHQFFLSDNGVWLTEHVPVKFIQFPEGFKCVV